MPKEICRFKKRPEKVDVYTSGLSPAETRLTASNKAKPKCSKS